MANLTQSNTTIGHVYLTVSNLERSLAYYQNGIGLKLHRREKAAAFLGVGHKDLLVLEEQPGAKQVRGTTGLYHFAILTPSRLELAKILRNLVETETPIGGASDHGVSEALYLSDPDGHGIEIYRDRPRNEWMFVNNQLQMHTAPLDLQGVLNELNGSSKEWTGLHEDTTIGHIHLHVADVRQSLAFYTEILGFDFVMMYGTSAGFISKDGYHHHIGMNTWAGEGVSPPPPDAVQLRWYEIQLPEAAALLNIIKKAQEHGIPIANQGHGHYLEDPAGNGIILTVKGG